MYRALNGVQGFTKKDKERKKTEKKKDQERERKIEKARESIDKRAELSSYDKREKDVEKKEKVKEDAKKTIALKAARIPSKVGNALSVQAEKISGTLTPESQFTHSSEEDVQDFYTLIDTSKKSSGGSSKQSSSTQSTGLLSSLFANEKFNKSDVSSGEKSKDFSEDKKDFGIFFT